LLLWAVLQVVEIEAAAKMIDHFLSPMFHLHSMLAAGLGTADAPAQESL